MLRSRQQLVHFVAEAGDGEEGVEVVRESMTTKDPFDVVLLDYIMPGINGPTTVERMRELGFKGIVIGVTGVANKAYIDVFIAHGADRVLVKPVGFNTLYETVRGIGYFFAYYLLLLTLYLSLVLYI